MSDSAFLLFNPIDLPRMSRSSQAISLAAHGVLAVALIAIPYAVQQTPAAHKRLTAVTLFAPRPLPPVVIRTFTPKPIVTKAAPVVVTHTFIPPPPVKPAVTQPRETITPALEVSHEVARAPEPKIELPELPALPTRPAPVITNTFDASRAAPARTGGAASGVKLGGFDVSAADRNGANGHSGVVAMAGFDNKVTAGGGGSGGQGARATRAAGFDAYRDAAAPARPMEPAHSTPQVTPVEISFKPKPAYTPEARQRKIEGEVQLEVIFRANGQISVVRVVHSLDGGLDESARAAANQIRFQPATRDGVPIDVRGIVHIVFELS